jgi:hypothetical protein
MKEQIKPKIFILVPRRGEVAKSLTKLEVFLEFNVLLIYS